MLIFKCSIDFLGQHYDLVFLMMAAELVSTNKQHIGNNTGDVKDAKWPSEGKGGVPPRTLMGLQCVAGRRTV